MARPNCRFARMEQELTEMGVQLCQLDRQRQQNRERIQALMVHPICMNVTSTRLRNRERLRLGLGLPPQTNIDYSDIDIMNRQELLQLVIQSSPREVAHFDYLTTPELRQSLNNRTSN